jgi:hypothetical protein
LDVTDLRAAYLEAAGTALALLREPAVAARWSQPSALPEFGVSGLAGHLANQVLSVPVVLATPVPSGAPIALLEHYQRSAWRGADVDAEINVSLRAAGEKLAADGPQALAEQVAAVLADLATRLPALPPGHVVHLPWGPWSLRLEDFLVTRMMEISVHDDDLAHSVDAATPVLPEAVLHPVLTLLTDLAVRRHGQPAVLRALTRAERAPAAINAL